MADLNRLKVVLVEQKKTVKWSATQLGTPTCNVREWYSNTVQPALKTIAIIAEYLLGETVRKLTNQKARTFNLQPMIVLSLN